MATVFATSEPDVVVRSPAFNCDKSCKGATLVSDKSMQCAKAGRRSVKCIAVRGLGIEQVFR